MQLWSTDATIAGTRKVYEWNVKIAIDNITSFGNSILFTMGSELWISNGTQEGTQILGTGAQSMKNFAMIAGTEVAIFNMQIQGIGWQLWRTDGTQPGTFRLIGNNPPAGGSIGESVGGFYYYPGSSGSGLELWRTDGTTTELVKDIYPGATSSNPRNFVPLNGKMFFIARDPITTLMQVFTTDGTPAGTQRVTSLFIANDNGLQQLTAFNNELYFIRVENSNDRIIYKTDGTPGDLTEVKNFGVVSPFPSSFRATSTELYFVFSTPATGSELWATNGTTVGTRLVKEFVAGAADGIGGLSTARIIGHELYLIVYPTPTSSEIWKTDGTTTEKIVSETGIGQMYNLAATSTGLLYSHNDGNLHGNIWASSTTGDIQKLKEFPPIPGNTYAGYEGTSFNGFLYMTLPSSDNTRHELWKTNGDDVFERILNAPKNPQYFQIAGNRLYFLADDGTHGQQVWYTDGTNMVMMTEFDAATEGEVSNQFFFVWGDRVFFHTLLAGQVTLWLTDVTGNGITALPPGPSGPFGIMNDKVYLSGVRDPQILQLWSSDGTAGGTQIIKEIDIVSSSSMALSGAQVLNGKLLFSASSAPYATSERRHQLWVTDGTTGGTIRFREEGFAHGGFQCIPYKGLAYFGGNDEESGFAIWRTDGTLQGTQKWFDPETGAEFSFHGAFNIIGDRLTFWWQRLNGYNFVSDELWSTDGITNPVRIMTFKHVQNYRHMMFNNTLVFNAEKIGDNTGEELWKTDGTGAGTQLIRDTEPGPTTGYVSDLMNFGDTFYFRTTVQNERRLWKSDGTTCRTQPMTDPADVIQRIFQYDNQRIIMNVQTWETGWEMFSYERALEPTMLCRTIQSIQYAAPNVYYSEQPIDFPMSSLATSSSGLPVEVEFSNPNVASISNGKLTTLGTGSVLLTLTQPGNATFEPAPKVTTTLTVLKRQQSLKFGTLASKKYGDAPFELIAASNSTNGVIFTSSDPTVIAISGNMATILKPGIVTITVTQPGDVNNLAATPITQPVTVAKGTQTINFTSIPVKTFGDTPFDLEATTSLDPQVTFTTTDENIISLTAATATIVKPGTVLLTATQAGNDFYLPASAEQTVVVNKATQVLTFTRPPDKIYGDASFAFQAETGTNAAIVFTTSDANVVTISGTTATIVKPGDVTLTASQPGDGFYLPASAEHTLTIGKASQTITFGIDPQQFSSSFVNLAATTSSTLPAVYTSNNSHVLMTGNKATFVASGKATITATQPGNEFYHAASPVVREFCIIPPKPSIALNMDAVPGPTLTSSAPVGNIWARNGTPLSLTTQTIQILNDGSYTLQVSIEGCVSSTSDPVNITITGVQEPPVIYGFPNPVRDIYYVSSEGATSYTVFDTAGRTISSGTFNSNYSIDFSEYVVGLYVVMVESEEKRHWLRVVKN